jgi:hypothetical protein
MHVGVVMDCLWSLRRVESTSVTHAESTFSEYINQCRAHAKEESKGTAVDTTTIFQSSVAVPLYSESDGTPFVEASINMILEAVRLCLIV